MKKSILISSTILLALLFNACKKGKDKVPTRDLSVGKTYSVAELRSIATSTNNHRILSEAYYKGVVIADEVSGNFYKELYVRDAANTGGIRFTFQYSGSNLFIGDSIRLNLKGYDVNIDATTGILTIDSVNFEKNLVKFDSGAEPKPIAISYNSSTYKNTYIGDLVTLTNYRFKGTDAGGVYADPVKQVSINRIIQNCLGIELTVRTSNYALFASEKTPTGFGSITGIATGFNGTDQIQIRTPKEINMNGTASCIYYLQKNFEDNSLNSGGWSQFSTLGTANWAVALFSGNRYAQISGFYSSANQNTENWLISPSVNLANSINPAFVFKNAYSFAGLPIEAYVSSNYTSGNPNSATWVQLTPLNISPGNYVFVNSGVFSLSAYKTANTRVAIKYKSSSVSGASRFQVDDFIIAEN